MSIRSRLTLFNALAIGAILALLGLFVYFVLREALLSGVEDTVRARAEEAANVVGAGETLSQKDVERLTLDGVYVMARDTRGEVLMRTAGTASADVEDTDDVWRRALESDAPVGDEVDTAKKGEDYVYAVPVDDPSGGRSRVVEAGKSYGAAETTLEALGAATAAGLFAALLLSVGGAYVLARAALSPVDAVARSAREITEGDLGRRLPVENPKDEIGRLATTVNGFLSRLEAAFARREEALDEREESLARQRRFASDAGHDLRTPLTSIVGHARLLERWGLEDPAAARKSVAAIRREAGRMEGLVEDLLALAQGDEGAPLDLRPQSLDGVVAEAVETARGTRSGVEVEYVPPEKPVTVPFDRASIHRATAILLDNAVKYTPEGGKVRAEVREEDGRALFAISDTGFGIPKDQLPHVFERFFRADSSRSARGAGLGLSIARQVAEAHGGSLEATSEPGKGSTFTLRLPRNEPIT